MRKVVDSKTPIVYYLICWQIHNNLGLGPVHFINASYNKNIKNIYYDLSAQLFCLVWCLE